MQGGFGLLPDELEARMKTVLTVMKLGEDMAVVPTDDATGEELLMAACVCIDMVSQMYHKDFNELLEKFYETARVRQQGEEEINWKKLIE